MSDGLQDALNDNLICDEKDEVTVPRYILTPEEAQVIFGDDYLAVPIETQKPDNYNPWVFPKSYNKDQCRHEWEMYTGLVEQFKHCKKCGVKYDRN